MKLLDQLTSKLKPDSEQPPTEERDLKDQVTEQKERSHSTFARASAAIDEFSKNSVRDKALLDSYRAADKAVAKSRRKVRTTH